MKTLIISFLSLMPVLVSAQDVLYKTDNTKLEVKVAEVTETTIKYKVFANPNGPLYTISKNTVALIVYQNGQHEVVKSPVQPVNTPGYSSPLYNDSVVLSKKLKRYNQVTQNKNVVFFNTVELLNSGIGVSYMREVCDNKILVHVPFARSFKSPELDNALGAFNSGGFSLKQTQYDLGLGLYVATSGKRSITHFIGPLIRNAQYSGTYNYYNSADFRGGQSTFSMNETSLMLNNGFLYRFTPKFNMMLNVAVGTFIKRTTALDGPSGDGIYVGNMNRGLAVHAGLHFGYRF